MNKKMLPLFLSLVFLIIALIVLKKQFTSSSSPSPTPQSSSPVLINAIPITKRPFITLTPDSSGHNLFLTLNHFSSSPLVNYELVYQAGQKQEGALGRLDLSQATQPLTETILLGSKSAGGAVTYHQNITGGSLTITYNNIKLKEDFNFFSFQPDNQLGYSSPDTHFTAFFSPHSLSQSAIIVVMKPFGLPTSLPTGHIKAGPYYVGTAKSVTPSKIQIKVQANKPRLYENVNNKWHQLESQYQNGLLTATPQNGQVFVVVE